MALLCAVIVPCDICSHEGIKQCTGRHIEGTPDKDWDGHCEFFLGERSQKPEGKRALVGKRGKMAQKG